jgi:DNA-directed RNA polymerase specialized sigma24 family protein
MTLYQKGDEAAFEEIYARYAKNIYRFLKRRLEDDCAELYQETFFRLHRGRAIYKTERLSKACLPPGRLTQSA